MFHSIFPPQYNYRKVYPRTKDNLDKWVNLNTDLNIEQEIWDYDQSRLFLKIIGYYNE